MVKRAEMDGAGGGYRIGTVAHLTGVDVHTIRAWERRHGAVRPARSRGGTRLYGDREIARLRLIRALTECGHAIGSIARLSDDELRDRLAKLAGAEPSVRLSVQGPVHVAILDGDLAEQLRVDAEGLAGLEVCVATHARERLLDAVRERGVELLILRLESLGEQPWRSLEMLREASGAGVVVVVYTFARRSHLARLAGQGAKLLRGPLDVRQLRRALSDVVLIQEATQRSGLEVSPDTALPAPPRRFDDARIARLREISSSIECECPTHLASIVASLVAFERYSQGCESRDAADAALHRRLARETGHARAVMESLLAAVCEHDRIRL